MDKREIWTLTRPKAIKAAKRKAKREASMTHACGLMLHGMSNFGAIAIGINEQITWLQKYQAWIDEMDDLYRD